MNNYPQKIHFSERVKVSITFACCCTSSYLLINYLPLRDPLILSQTVIDQLIPFIPWTIWPYLLLLLTDLVFPLLIVERRLFRFTMRAYAFTALISFAVWALFPTTLPRSSIIPHGDSISEIAYRLLISVDPPNNCFPSGHISIPTVLFWALGKQWGTYKIHLWLCFALLSVTILTTKQHYFVDLVGGLTAGVLGLGLSHLREKSR